MAERETNLVAAGSTHTARELLVRSIEFRCPYRIPFTIQVPPAILDNEPDKGLVREVEEKARYAVSAQGFKSGLRLKLFNGDPEDLGDGKRRDAWGCIIQHGAFVHHPLAHDVAKVRTYPFPDPDDPARYRDIRRIMAEEGNDPDRPYAGVCLWAGVFERMWMLRGMENLLTDMYVNRKEFIHLRDRVLEFHLATIDNLTGLGLDGILFGDDWGTQQGLFIRPDDWRRYFRPCYKKIFRRIRDAGSHAIMHSCGDVLDIVPDLIECGVQVLNPVQSMAMDIDELGTRYRGKLCFWGGVSNQRELTAGTPSDVRRQVRYLIDRLATERGGLTLSPDQSLPANIPLRNINAFLDACLEMGGYLI